MGYLRAERLSHGMVLQLSSSGLPQCATLYPCFLALFFGSDKAVAPLPLEANGIFCHLCFEVM